VFTGQFKNGRPVKESLPDKDMVAPVLVADMDNQDMSTTVTPANETKTATLYTPSEHRSYVYYNGRVCHLEDRSPVDGTVEYLFVRWYVLSR